MIIGKDKIVVGNMGISRNKAIAVFLVFVYKIILEYGYYAYLCRSTMAEYTLDFSFVKYINGLIWVTAIVLSIRVADKRISSFMLFLQFMIGIVPLTVMYAMENNDPSYYNLVCFWYFVACLLVNVSISKKKEHKPVIVPHMDMLIVIFFIGITLAVTVYYFVHNGMPKQLFLGFDSVYDVRSTRIVIANKYLGYVADIVTNVALPVLITYCLVHKQGIAAIIWFAMYYIYYIYSGNKTMLFAIPLILIIYFFAKKGDCTIKIFALFTAGIAAVTAGVMLIGNTVFVWGYSLIVRRILLFPADIKFNYYDYFCTHPKIGLSGMPFIGRLFTSGNIDIGNIIGQLYYNSSDMNATTGFLAEGFERFGNIGFLIEMVAFVIVLKLLDFMQERVGYTMGMTMSIYLIYSLNDAQLIRSLMSGPMMMLIIIALLFYDRQRIEANDLITYRVNDRKRECNAKKYGGIV